jgi:prolyl-tRNA editing enzyme YbaK/EbsC (Cys-tRNA(Pro) deacylase)
VRDPHFAFGHLVSRRIDCQFNNDGRCKSVAPTLQGVWPEAVEGIAAFLRGAAVEGRLEELLPGAALPAGQKLRADAFDTESGPLVVLVPSERRVDEQKLAAAASCGNVRAAQAIGFPFEGARVLMDQAVLSAHAVWLEAGSPRHVLGMSPAQLARVTSAKTADLLREG